MIHLQEKALEVIKDLRSNGFNGVRFYRCVVEPTELNDFFSDYAAEIDVDIFDLSLEQKAVATGRYEAWRANYVAIITEADFLYISLTEDLERYFHVYPNEGLFYEDLKEFFVQQFGSDVNLTFRQGCFEWEIIRPTNP